MAQQSSQSAAMALNWNAAASNIDRFNKPLQSTGQTTFGFKGFPDNNMLQPKQPLRHMPSADLTSDVNRYFRKDSPPEWHPPPNQPPARMLTPPQQKEPNWLQEKRNSPPTEAVHQTISPRYKEEPQSHRKHPVIFDPRGELSSADKRKKVDEYYIAEEDLAMARERKEMEKRNKVKEQQKIREMQEDFNPYGQPGGGAPRGDNRKMKFTEHQLHKSPEPQYHVPQGMKYADEDRGMDWRQNMPERREVLGRAATMPMVRTSYSDSYRPKTEMMHDQAKEMRHLQEEIDRLKAQDDMVQRRDERPMYENPRAKSDERFFDDFEPQTDRAGYRRHNRDGEIFGQSVQKVPEYLNISPRRNPVGKLYNKDSTYTTDFDIPFGKHGTRNLGNPNKEAMEPFNPFGLEGGGAPMVDSSGQRKTRIAGSLGQLGREMSDSARARRAHKRELLNEIGEQAAYDKARKEREKEYYRQGFVEMADSMRQKRVGFPRYNQNGLISQHHHLPHMFETTPYAERAEQKNYHDFLQTQIQDRNALNNLGKLEEKRQAREHFRTLDSFFGRHGGGNVKGPDTRKVNLDKAIYNPQSTSQYYNKVRLEDELSPHEILDKFKPRITINSTHKNLYEYPQGDLKRIDVRNYMGRV